MAANGIDAEVARNLAEFLEGLGELSSNTGIVITCLIGQQHLEDGDGNALPVRLNRANGAYVLEEPYA
jgi:hypothetical protein